MYSMFRNTDATLTKKQETTVPAAKRNQPVWQQIASYYTEKIASGELQPHTQLPTRRGIAQDWGVGLGSAEHAMNALVSAQLVYTDTQGTYVSDRRLIMSPTHRIRSRIRKVVGERIQVIDAALIDPPAYIGPILGLADGDQVIRREQIHYEGDVPAMLSVAWFPSSLADLVPELLNRRPIDTPGEAVKLIQDRTQRVLGRIEEAREARPIKDDGREGPLLRLPKGAACLAEVYILHDQHSEVIEYGEYVIPQGRVTLVEYEV
jgi:GntR family transcriptional regulator